MPEIREDDFTCFVHGHGAKYSSAPAEEKKDGLRQRLLTPLTLALARKRAEAQLAFQRIAGKSPEKKK